MEIITTRNVETQEQLLEALQGSGFNCTQATISRDIKELRIVKELSNLGTYRYATSSGEIGNSFTARLNKIFRECVISYDYAQNIIIIRTLPGLASAAGSAIAPGKWFPHLPEQNEIHNRLRKSAPIGEVPE